MPGLLQVFARHLVHGKISALMWSIRLQSPSLRRGEAKTVVVVEALPDAFALARRMAPYFSDYEKRCYWSRALRLRARGVVVEVYSLFERVVVDLCQLRVVFQFGGLPEGGWLMLEVVVAVVRL